MTIRRGRPEDWEAIQALNLQIFEAELLVEPSSNLSFPDSDEAIAYFQKAAQGQDDHISFVSEHDDVVVGYAIVKLIPAKEMTHRVGISQAQLHTLGVDKAHRGRGIGKQLIAAAREWAIAQGANRLKVVAYAGNEGARKLYRSVGFRELEVVHEMKLGED